MSNEQPASPDCVFDASLVTETCRGRVADLKELINKFLRVGLRDIGPVRFWSGICFFADGGNRRKNRRLDGCLVYRIMGIANRPSYESPGQMEKPAQQASPVASRQPRIVIADDFETLRRGLKCLLGTAICGEAKTANRLLRE
jgi:hypothetical protein